MTETKQAITDEVETSDIMLKYSMRGAALAGWIIVNVMILVVGVLYWRYMLVA